MLNNPINKKIFWIENSQSKQACHLEARYRYLKIRRKGSNLEPFREGSGTKVQEITKKEVCWINR